VLLAAGGLHKVKLIRAVVEAGLCNTLITDFETANSVVGLPRRRDLEDVDELTSADQPLDT
jgi:hypothetical protein